MGSHQSFLRHLEREFDEEYSPEYEFEEELAAPAPPPVLPGTLRSLRFVDEPELHMVAEGRLRLGRVNDSPYPAPIRSQGRAVRKIQQALIDLGYSLPRYGDDGDTGATFLGSPLLSFGWKPSRWCASAMNVCWKSRPSLSFGRKQSS